VPLRGGEGRDGERAGKGKGGEGQGGREGKRREGELDQGCRLAKAGPGCEKYVYL